MNTFKFTKTIADEDIINIVDQAMRGAVEITWADEFKWNLKYRDAGEALLAGLVVGIHDAEDEKWINLSLKKLLKGLSLTQNHDYDSYDMFDADTVLQNALFGKQVYA